MPLTCHSASPVSNGSPCAAVSSSGPPVPLSTSAPPAVGDLVRPVVPRHRSGGHIDLATEASAQEQLRAHPTCGLMATTISDRPGVLPGERTDVLRLAAGVPWTWGLKADRPYPPGWVAGTARRSPSQPRETTRTGARCFPGELERDPGSRFPGPASMTMASALRGRPLNRPDEDAGGRGGETPQSAPSPTASTLSRHPRVAARARRTCDVISPPAIIIRAGIDLIIGAPLEEARILGKFSRNRSTSPGIPPKCRPRVILSQ